MQDRGLGDEESSSPRIGTRITKCDHATQSCRRDPPLRSRLPIHQLCVRQTLSGSRRDASMGSVGDCYDNAMAESFWATLEREVLSHRRFKTQAEAKTAIFAWIEGWYNPHRRHSSLGRRSPMNYEC